MVASLTLNCQNEPLNLYEDYTFVPDAWHSQTIFKTDEENVYLTNPIQKMSYDLLRTLLFSESIIKIQKKEVWHHCKNMSESEIHSIEWPNEAWREMKVTEQILDVIKQGEEYMLDAVKQGKDEVKELSGHMSIPYAGKAGVWILWKI